MPPAPSATPRKILPPPMTIATSTPSFTTAPMSATIASTVVRLIPNASSPMSASPDSFSSTLRYAALSPADMRPPAFRSAACRGNRGHFGREIRLLLLDAFTDNVEHEVVDLRAPGLQQLLDRLLAVFRLHEDLAQQRDLLQEFLHGALGDLVEHRLWLARLARLLDRDAALGIEQHGRHAGGIERLGLAGRDVHRDVLRKFRVAPADVNQHADLAATVHIACQPAPGLQAGEAADRHI